MPRYIDLDKQLVRLYRLNITSEDVVKEFLLSAEFVDVPEKKSGSGWRKKSYMPMKRKRSSQNGSPASAPCAEDTIRNLICTFSSNRVFAVGVVLT